jgi:hypothetical protein
MSQKLSSLHSMELIITRTRTLLDHQRQMKKVKGENFNVFSVLGLSSSEDRLHSRFIRELLNPKGSHLKGRLFLNLFLGMLQEKFGEKESLFTGQNAYSTVKREFHIGSIDLKTKTGGRIDIYLQDSSGASICIENKIYAGDQMAQIERYCNYNRANNKVFYLTLHGTEPIKDSCGDLKVDEDFYLLSYKEDILHWLEKCLKEVFDTPILRESIKQYLIVVQKLTNTMNNQYEEEFLNLILNNLEASRYIANNYTSIIHTLQRDFKNDLGKKLLEAIVQVNDWRVYDVANGDNVASKFSSIWILPDRSQNTVLKYGIENFNGNTGAHWKGDLFIGVFSRRNSEASALYIHEEKPHSSWVRGKRIMFDGKPINLSSKEHLQIIRNPDSDIYHAFKTAIIEQSIEYMISFEKELGTDITLLRPVKKDD